MFKPRTIIFQQTFKGPGRVTSDVNVRESLWVDDEDYTKDCYFVDGEYPYRPPSTLMTVISVGTPTILGLI